MASATWRIRLLKLDLALVAKARAASHKSRPRRLRPRLSAEQLEDRTLPSGGVQLLEPAVHPSPTPPPQGPAAQGSPSHVNDGNSQGQNNPSPLQGQAAHGPSSSANHADGQGQDNPPNPQATIGQGSLSPANSGQGLDNSKADQAQAGQGSLSPSKNDHSEENNPPSAGPAAQGSPLPANSGNGQGQNNTPAGPSAHKPSSPATDDNGQGQGNLSNPQGPTGQGSRSAANNGQGNGHTKSDQESAGPGSLSPANNGQESDDSTSQKGQIGQGSGAPANNDQGENNPTSPQGSAGQEPENDQQPTPQHDSAAQGYKSPANNGQGQNNNTPEPAANGQGNGNGQGESENSNGESQNPPSKQVSAGTANRQASPLTSQSNGSENESSQGTDTGQVVDSAQAASSRPLASASAAVSSSIGATSAEVAAESNAAEVFTETLLAEESIALGVLAEVGSSAAAPAASPSRASVTSPADNEEVADPDTGPGSAGGGGTPVQIASSTVASGGGAFSAFVTGLQEKSAKDEFKPLASNTPITDLDKLYLEWWDEDQMLFPDTMPPIDEMLFPEAMPQLNDMILPNDMLLPNESSPGEDASLDLGRLGLVPTAAPTPVRWEDVLARDAPAIETSEAHRFDPNSQPVSAMAWLESDSTISELMEEPSSGDNLRPYHIALGMMPFLVAIGYTPSSLREHVHEGQRIWKRLRGYLRR